MDLTNLELDEEDQEDFIERSKIVKDKFLRQSINILDNNSFDVSLFRRVDVIIRAIK
jgi:hypothetical protein